jgi:hypothetical protein
MLRGISNAGPLPTPPSLLRRKERGANKNRRKSRYPWTKDGGHIWTHPVCKSPLTAACERDACINPASSWEEGLSSRALMESALLLLIRSTALKGPAPRRF